MSIPIPNVAQLKEFDLMTLEKESISSLELMERASNVFTNWFCEKFPDHNIPIHIFSGNTNNGADGLAIARLLNEKGYVVSVFLCNFSEKKNLDFEANLKRLKSKKSILIQSLSEEEIAQLTISTNPIIIIDALIGYACNKEFEEPWSTLIQKINTSNQPIVSVDMPSGMFADRTDTINCINATHTLSFEFPKLSFLLPENGASAGDWNYNSIGLNYLDQHEKNFPYNFLELSDIKSIFKPRRKFAHKYTNGHVLLIAGSHKMAGAALLAASASMRSGAGLVSVCIPEILFKIVHEFVPEAICINLEELMIHSENSNYHAIAIGPGLGKHATMEAIFELIRNYDLPTVIDAEAINYLASNKHHVRNLPKNSILTPHAGEFDRLFGTKRNTLERIETARKKAGDHNLIIILKGRYSAICLPSGKVFFNSTGNPGLATAGSGDVLTGMIAAFLSHQYTAEESCMLACYLHGIAGDLAAENYTSECMIARDIIEYIPSSVQHIMG
ncbi:MAG: NAD(P)H-hydrate dehydratase [Bacteroidota bacterium]|nr:NAD(P)H-hydrate dehydratase [Bacteroidota bacterium]